MFRRQLTLKKGVPGDQVWDLLCMQLASYLEEGPLEWMLINKKNLIMIYMTIGIVAYIKVPLVRGAGGAFCIQKVPMDWTNELQSNFGRSS